MSVQRYISTSFWDDDWIQSLDPSEKLLYLYLMTNPLTSISGVYKIGLRRICFDTGFNTDTVSNILTKFESAKKVHRIGEYIAIPSWPKHQKWETKKTIEKGIIANLLELPPSVLAELVKISYRFNLHIVYDTLGIAYPCDTDTARYRPSYSDSDSDIDSDTDTDTDTDSDASAIPPRKAEFFHLSQKPIPIQNDGTSRIERARAAWNGLAPLIGPECRLMAIQFKRDDLDDCLRIMSVYSDDEIAEAIQNYCNLKTDSEYDPPRYGGFIGFMRGGVEKFISAANPQDIFKKRKGFESAAEREDRERAEALRRLGVEP